MNTMNPANPVHGYIQTLSKQQLQEQLEQALWNDGFGCYTKYGLKNIVWPAVFTKARYLIYFDVDGLHDINEANKGDYAVFDAWMKSVLSSLRSTDIVAGQLNSGDEFIIVMLESDERSHLDPDGLMKRLFELLAEQGLSATYAIVPVVSPSLDVSLAPAITAVFEAKIARGIKR